MVEAVVYLFKELGTTVQLLGSSQVESPLCRPSSGNVLAEGSSLAQGHALSGAASSDD